MKDPKKCKAPGCRQNAVRIGLCESCARARDEYLGSWFSEGATLGPGRRKKRSKKGKTNE
jgi:hypothetical protein